MGLNHREFRLGIQEEALSKEVNIEPHRGIQLAIPSEAINTNRHQDIQEVIHFEDRTIK